MTEIAYPGALQTMAKRLNNLGVVAGIYADSVSVRGLTSDSVANHKAAVDFPGAALSELEDINDLRFSRGPVVAPSRVATAGR